ncbi:MAG: FAD-binding oxidoreductase [Parvularculaceae bacterium]
MCRWPRGCRARSERQDLRAIRSHPASNSKESFLLKTSAGRFARSKFSRRDKRLYAGRAVQEGLHGVHTADHVDIIATRPLQDEELRSQGWTSRNMAYDTRLFLHYFRLLPDNRFLFGMRGGADASPEGLKCTERRTRAHFEALFPAWRDVGHDYFWSGFVCFTRNLAPYLGPIGALPGAWAAFGYHGSGVAMASWSGRQVADLIAGKTPLDAAPAVLRQPLRKFPFPNFRKAGLTLALGLSDLFEPLPENRPR